LISYCRCLPSEYLCKLSTYLPQPLVLLVADLSPAGRPSRRAKNWAKSLEKRHPELKKKKVKALGWDHHKKNVFPDITRWFDIVGEALSNLELTRESVYIIDEAGVMLSKLGCVAQSIRHISGLDYTMPARDLTCYSWNKVGCLLSSPTLSSRLR
jgi:hypothetical protein